MLAIVLAHIATHSRHYHRLGKEALLCASAYLFVQAGIRLLSTNGYMEPGNARAITGIAAFCCLAIIGQLAWLRRKDHRIRCHKEEPTPL